MGTNFISNILSSIAQEISAQHIDCSG